MRFDGKKHPTRFNSVANGEKIPGTRVRFLPYRKRTVTYAVRMREPFEVETIEGLHEGKAGDYLAVGIHGEMYPIDADVFKESYEPIPMRPA